MLSGEKKKNTHFYFNHGTRGAIHNRLFKKNRRSHVIVLSHCNMQIFCCDFPGSESREISAKDNGQNRMPPEIHQHDEFLTYSMFVITFQGPLCHYFNILVIMWTLNKVDCG